MSAELSKFQEIFIDRIEKNNITTAYVDPAMRRIGKSTLMDAINVWFLIFGDNVNLMHSSPNSHLNEDARRRIFKLLINLPYWMVFGDLNNSDPKTIKMPNGNTLRFILPKNNIGYKHTHITLDGFIERDIEQYRETFISALANPNIKIVSIYNESPPFAFSDTLTNGFWH